MIEHDVCIIGGSLAGSACVRELLRLKIDVVAFERDRFPRPKVCGGFLSSGAVSCLDQLGVLNEVRAAGAVPVYTARIRVGRAATDIPFDAPGGLGISRAALDTILGAQPEIRQGQAVLKVTRRDGRFIVSGESFEVSCRILIDAAGKLSRFSGRRATDEFGIQYEEPGDRGAVMDFWFFEDGYGGAVSIEGNRTNCCLLIRKEKLDHYLGNACHVTGPLAYDRVRSEYIAIGDATGMVDPFCGEGMRHALDTGMVAARSVARGIRDRRTYEEIRVDYEYEWYRRWSRRRGLAAAFRFVAGFVREGVQVNERTIKLMHRWWQRYSE
jgi:flavin-dependent dehydrogenase